MEFEKLSRDEKLSFFAAIIALIAFILPWFGLDLIIGNTAATVMNDVDKSVNIYHASNPYLKGYEVDYSFLGILAIAATLYLIMIKNKYSVFSAGAAVLFAIIAYSKISSKIAEDSGHYVDSFGGIKPEFKYGFFVFIISCAVMLFQEFKMAGYIDKILAAKRTLEEQKKAGQPE